MNSWSGNGDSPDKESNDRASDPVTPVELTVAISIQDIEGVVLLVIR